MFSTNIFNFLILVGPVLSLRFNNFRHLTQEMISSVSLADTTAHQTLWLEQKLDHFDENETRTWKMRYFRRRDLWRPAGPIYVFLGGEDEASPSFLYSGIAYELAKETNGVLYATEHRYYGKSRPVNGTLIKDLKYLTARQALADNAHLIRTIKRNPIFWGSKVVVIGGSYPGNLAAWMKLFYPTLVNAAIASSAPVLAKKDFYEYLEKVNYDYGRYGTEGCWKAINDRFQRYDTLFKTKKGIDKLKEEENICHENDMSIPENKQLFFQDKMYSFKKNAQYGNTYRIKKHCVNFNTIKEALQFPQCDHWIPWKQCYNYDFDSLIHSSKHSDVSWLYQACSEFGYFQSTSSDGQPFTKNVPIDYYIKTCTRVFGPEFNNTRIEKGINDVNKMYGGLKPNVTNVIFVNGDLDPWSRLGILEHLSEDAPAIFIPRASHCRDLYSNRAGDEKELKDARRSIKHYIKKWIGIADLVHK